MPLKQTVLLQTENTSTNTHTQTYTCTHAQITLFPLPKQPKISLGIWRIQLSSCWVKTNSILWMQTSREAESVPSWAVYIYGNNSPHCVYLNRKYFSHDSIQPLHVQKTLGQQSKNLTKSLQWFWHRDTEAERCWENTCSEALSEVGLVFSSSLKSAFIKSSAWCSQASSHKLENKHE